MFKLDVPIDDQMTLSVFLRNGATRGELLFSSKGKPITEASVIDSIGESRAAMLLIRKAAIRGIVLADGDSYLVPVLVQAVPNNTPVEVTSETEIIVRQLISSEDHNDPREERTNKPQPVSVPQAEVMYLRSLHEMSIQTIGIVTKSANESMAKVSAAQAESLKAITTNLSQVQQSIEKLGNLPLRIFEDANEKVEALLLLAKDRAEEKHGSHVQTKDVVSELKELLSLATSVKSMIGTGT